MSQHHKSPTQGRSKQQSFASNPSRNSFPLQEISAAPAQGIRTRHLSNTSSRLYKDAVLPQEPNPDEVLGKGKEKQLPEIPPLHHKDQPEYGTEVDTIGSDYEFYSNPNSRPQSLHPASSGNFKMVHSEASREPLMPRDPYLAHPASPVDAFGTLEKSGLHPHTMASGNTLNGSAHTIESDEALARRLAREQLDMENAPEGMAGKEIPRTLYDPEVRQGMPTLKSHKPWFLGVMTAIQVVTVIVSFVLNQQFTGSVIQTNPFNVMIGPTPGVLIQMGARFLPCVRNTTLNTGSTPIILCPDGIKSNTSALNPSTNQPAPSCTLEQICGLGGFNGGEPNQWYRFLIPIFLHGGVVHLLVNMLFQVQTGFQLERDFGWWRTAAIYFIAGIGGFIFGGNFNGLTPSVGCSGALFGLMACLVIDLFQNWKVIQNPWWELAKLIFTILLSFLIGMLPFIDNFAHVGGFFCGIFAGLIFMPTIHYSKWDGRVKIGLMVVSIPIIIMIYVFLIRGFYTGQNDCPWCKYINCIPGMPWCEQKWNQNITTT
ncbi:hypothetical protein HDU67_000240 [Dinochytrium kinnereticum]|nr:hypothetical protein HDU67_000240 [Dinochytrium kinnereticum]